MIRKTNLKWFKIEKLINENLFINEILTIERVGFYRRFISYIEIYGEKMRSFLGALTAC